VSIAIIVHGGAWDIPADLHDGHLTGCRAAAEAGWALLERGASALDAVEAAIRVMEDHPVFDAGLGSHLNRDGDVELDAAIMDGCSLMAGAVASLKRIANPITLARRVLHDSEHVFLVGAGAERFAETIGLSLCDPASLVIPREQQAWETRRAMSAETVRTRRPFGPVASDTVGAADTVGALALDGAGNLAAGNSTGGTMYKHPGRIGDTPLIGCGLYADNQLGAAACTGWGEQIIKVVLAKATADRIASVGDAQAAAAAAVAHFRQRVGGLGGVIALSPDGRIGLAHSTPYLAHAYRTSAQPAVIAALRHA
jgi:beta-aspartyl-peptidase (threonine type)